MNPNAPHLGRGSMPDDFIPPPADEPAPIQPTNGAGVMPDDPDQADVSQEPIPDLDEAAHFAMLTSAAGVTAHTILTLAASQIGTGEKSANVNKYTRWFYGGGTSAAWCWIFLCWLFDQRGVLALIFGKHAYVPDFRKVFSAHAEFHTGSPKAGDLVAFDFNRSGSPEHIGIIEKVISASELQTIEGNTDNKVLRRRRARSYVYGYATPKYAPSAPPKPADPNAYPGTVFQYVTGHPIMHGSHVIWIQQRLVKHGHAVKVDGEYGVKTAGKVAVFQHDAHLTIDGQVGSHTWAALAK